MNTTAKMTRHNPATPEMIAHAGTRAKAPGRGGVQGLRPWAWVCGAKTRGPADAADAASLVGPGFGIGGTPWRAASTAAGTAAGAR